MGPPGDRRGPSRTVGTGSSNWTSPRSTSPSRRAPRYPSKSPASAHASAVSQSLNEDRTLALLKEKGLLDQCTEVVVVLNEDAILAANYARTSLTTS